MSYEEVRVFRIANPKPSNSSLTGFEILKQSNEGVSGIIFVKSRILYSYHVGKVSLAEEPSLFSYIKELMICENVNSQTSESSIECFGRIFQRILNRKRISKEILKNGQNIIMDYHVEYFQEHSEFLLNDLRGIENKRLLGCYFSIPIGSFAYGW